MEYEFVNRDEKEYYFSTVGFEEYFGYSLESKMEQNKGHHWNVEFDELLFYFTHKSLRNQSQDNKDTHDLVNPPNPNILLEISAVLLNIPK